MKFKVGDVVKPTNGRLWPLLGPARVIGVEGEDHVFLDPPLTESRFGWHTDHLVLVTAAEPDFDYELIERGSFCAWTGGAVSWQHPAPCLGPHEPLYRRVHVHTFDRCHCGEVAK